MESCEEEGFGGCVYFFGLECMFPVTYPTTSVPSGCQADRENKQFPYLITINTLLPALVAGNAVILRPSPQTPLVGERLLEIFNEAGLPANVLQLAHVGSLEALDEIVQIPEIASVSFTGSTDGGIRLREATAKRILPMNLELGGKDAAYVRKDVDIQFAAGEVVDGAVFNSGQSCCSIERVYVHGDVYEKFLSAVQDVLKGSVFLFLPFYQESLSIDSSRYNLGNPTDPTTTIGPVISQQAKTRIQGHIDDAFSKGAVDVTTPNSSFKSPPAGSYVPPTLLVNVTHDMRVMREETFGPVIPAMKVWSDEEAIRLINDSQYGLTASVWTEDLHTATGLIEEIEAGTVFVNRCDYPSPVGYMLLRVGDADWLRRI